MAPWQSFYTSPPRRAIALDELESSALLRIHVLRAIASVSTLGQRFCLLQNLPTATREALEKLHTDEDLDNISHYALRLAFCTDHNRLEWLVEAESRLLSLRVQLLPPPEALRILESQNQNYEAASFEQITDRLSAEQRSWLHMHDHIREAYYRVPFNEVSQLVGFRQVIVDGGCCWVATSRIHHVVRFHFKRSLREQLVALHRSLPAKQAEIDRLQSVIEVIFSEAMKMDRFQTASSSSITGSAPLVTPENIDTMAERHFPLCMKHLHRKMRQNHHLKFAGRVQYRVFLKGLGFSVHDNIAFFRNEFTQVIPPAKFDKEYVYHIRHSYGLEGSRKDYAPMDCHKIITGGAPRHGQYHGCPFKHWDSTALRNELRRMGVESLKAESIAHEAANGQHQRACSSLFKVLHHRRFDACLEVQGGDGGGLQMHPNLWVQASCKCMGQVVDTLSR